jgi:hypothetical protein
VHISSVGLIIPWSRYDTDTDDDGQIALLAAAFTNMRTVAAFSMQYAVRSHLPPSSLNLSTDQ